MACIESARLTELLGRQHGMVSYAQLRDHGVTRSAINHRIACGRWMQTLPRIISVTNGVPTRDAVHAAALLYGGPRSLLSHHTAAAEWGLRPQTDSSATVHITVPYRDSAVTQPASAVHPGVIVHRSRAIAHIAAIGAAPARTSWAATVLDVVTSEPSARLAAETLVSLLTNTTVDLRVIDAHLELRKPRRYGAAIAATLKLLTTGVQSMLEYRYAVDVEQAHGLPPGRRQRPVVVDGRILYEDVSYEPLGVRLIVRLDGRVHQLRDTRFRDRRRDNIAELTGTPRLTYGWEDTIADPCAVFREVRQVLRREGADVTWHPCPRCT